MFLLCAWNSDDLSRLKRVGGGGGEAAAEHLNAPLAWSVSKPVADLRGGVRPPPPSTPPLAIHADLQ